MGGGQGPQLSRTTRPSKKLWTSSLGLYEGSSHSRVPTRSPFGSPAALRASTPGYSPQILWNSNPNAIPRPGPIPRSGIVTTRRSSSSPRCWTPRWITCRVSAKLLVTWSVWAGPGMKAPTRRPHGSLRRNRDTPGKSSPIVTRRIRQAGPITGLNRGAFRVSLALPEIHTIIICAPLISYSLLPNQNSSFLHPRTFGPGIPESAPLRYLGPEPKARSQLARRAGRRPRLLCVR